MGGANPVMAIKVVATVAEMKAALKDGAAEIVTTTAAMQKMAAGFQGEKLKQQAGNIVAAVREIGGASRLSESEAARVNATLGKAIEKYRLFGQTAPAAMLALYDATKRTVTPVDALAVETDRLLGRLSGGGLQTAQAYVAAVQQLGGASKLTEAEQRQVNASLSEAIAKYAALGQSAPPAMVALAEATKRVEAETSKAADPVSKLDTFVGDLKGRVLATAAGFLTADAAIGVVSGSWRTMTDFVQSSIDSYAAAEKAQKTLTVALTQQGTAAPEVIAQYNELSAVLQRTTVVSDDTATEMQALLVQVGNVMPSQMQAALSASADLSAGLGIDLQAATMLVAKAAAGHTETLGRYGIRVDEAKVKSQGLGAVLEAVNRQFGGQAAAQLDTYAGRLQQIKNNWDNTKEAIGGAILLDPKLQALMRTVAEGSEAGAGGAERLADGFQSLQQNAVSAIPFLNMFATALATINRSAQIANEAASEQATMMRLAAAGTKDLRVEKTAELDVSTMLWRIKEQGRQQDEQVAEQQRAAKEAARALREEHERIVATTLDVTATAKGWEAVLDTIDGKVVEGARFYRDHGVELGKVGEIYGLTAVQVAALGTALDLQQAKAAALRVELGTSQGLSGSLATTGMLVDAVSQGMLTGLGPNSQLVGTVINELALRDLPKLNASLGATLKSLAGPNQQLAALSFSAQLGATLQKDLPRNVMAAITGGGSVLQAAGSTLGGFLTSPKGLGDTLSKGLTKMLGAGLGGAMSAMLPGIGALAGPLLEKLFSLGGPSAQELAGRKAAQNFEAGVAATLTASQRAEAGGRSWAMTVIGVRDAYLAVGRSAAEAEAAVQRLWAAEAQGEEAVAAVAASMRGVMDQAAKLRQAASAFGPSRTELQQMATDAKATYDYMLQSGVYTAEQLAAAFEASQQAQARALGINTEAQKKNLETLKAGLTDLQQRRDQLWQQIAAEAPEDVTGVIEAGQRAQLQTLEKDLAEKQVQLEAQAQDAAKALEDALASIQDRIQPLVVPIVYDPKPFPGAVGLDPIPMANGGFGEVNGPTLFLAGEKGRREQVAFSGADRTFQERGFGGGSSARTEALLERIAAQNERQASQLPQLVGIAVRDSLFQARVRR